MFAQSTQAVEIRPRAEFTTRSVKGASDSLPVRFEQRWWAGNRKRELTAVLQQVDVFSGLDAPELGRLAERFCQLAMSEDQLIFRQGDPADALYVVREGEVTLYRDQWGKPLQLLERFQAGSCVGEQGLLDGMPRSASARTSASSRILRIGKNDLMAYVRDRPDLELNLQILSARRHTLNAAAALELGRRREVRIRLAEAVILELADGSRETAVLQNLSQGGLSVSRGPADWHRNSRVRFTVIYGGHRLPVAGRVTWRQGDTFGVAFLRPESDLSYRVHAFLQVLGAGY